MTTLTPLRRTEDIKLGCNNTRANTILNHHTQPHLKTGSLHASTSFYCFKRSHEENRDQKKTQINTEMKGGRRPPINMRD
ncbi:hypothetical protein Bca4012_067248 [Brassica carinata]